MNDVSGFFLMMFVTAFATGAAVLFSDQSVRPVDIDWATSSCTPNGGIKTLSADIEDLEVRCVNGAAFTAEKKSTKGSQP